MATIQFQGLPTSSSPKLLFPSMASSTWPLSFLRMRLTVSSHVSKPKLLHCENMLSCRNHWIVSAISKKKTAKTELDDVSEGESIDISSENSKKPSRRGTRKSSNKTTEEIIPVKAAADLPENIDISLENINISSETDKKPSRRGRKKSSKKTAEEIIPVEATTELTVDQEQVWTKNQPDKIGISSDNTDISSESSKKSTRRGPKKSSKKTIEEIIPVGDTTELTENHLEATKEPVSPTEELQNEKYYMRNLDPSEKKIDFSILDDKDEGENEGFMWPPLVICFGPAKASFIPYARPSKRIFDQEIHKEMPDLYWSPDQFFRAPGSAASSVAIALARLDGRVDFMGKLGHDSFGKDIWSELNVYGVQTRCTKIDDSVSTAVSFMKLTSDRDGLKAKCVGSCAEDTFLNSDINLDGLKEAKMLYFNSSALLDPKSKSTLMEVIRIMKSQGNLIFFDVNLPMPLWHSPEEAKSFLKEAFAVSNFIELTQQELDYLCGIERNVMERKRDVKFVHRSRKRLEEFWHDGLEVLFVTNGTSGVSYYTKEDDHYFVGTEDVQIEPSSCEMSASGDALVAALMKMLVSEPHMATDPSYLETSIWYAIESGLIAQTLATGESGFYAD